MKKGVKTYVSIMLVMILLCTFVTALAFAKNDNGRGNGKSTLKIGFYDVDQTVEWARFAIDKMFAKGIIKGYGNGIFRPQSSVTHLEAIIMALRVMGWEDETEQIKDLPYGVKGIRLLWDGGYYYVAVALNKGIITLEELKGFNPNQAAKRYEVAKYVVRALGMESRAKRHMDEKLPFKDSRAIPKDAVGYVYVITQELGLMEGYNNSFHPQKSISRAEMAVLMNRLDDFVEDDEKGPDNQLVGTVRRVDVERNRITISREDGNKTYEVMEGAPVYINSKYRELEDLRQGDEVELVLGSEGKVIFIQVTKVSDRVTVTVEGLVTDVDTKKETVSVFTTELKGKAFVGILAENNISGRHYELTTEHERFVLTGDTDGLDDYLGKKIIVIGEPRDVPNIYMRGELLDVEKFYEANTRNTVEFDIDDGASIAIDGRRKTLNDIDPGDFAEIRAVDGAAISIKVTSFESIKGEREKDREESEELVKIKGKIHSLSLDPSRMRIKIENSDGRFTYQISDDVRLNGIDDLNELELGLQVELRIRDNQVVRISVDD